MCLKNTRLMFIIGLAVAATILGILVFAPNSEQNQPIAGDEQTQNIGDLFSFETPDCMLPCLLGITPGETDKPEALAIADTYASITPEDAIGYFYIQCEAENCIRTEFGFPDPRLGSYVSRMTLMVAPPRKLTTLGEMFEQGYTVQRVFRRSVAGPNAVSLIVVFTGKATIIADVSGTGKIDPDSPISSLTIVADQDLEFTLNFIYLTGASRPSEISWPGYAPIENYQNVSPLQTD